MVQLSVSLRPEDDARLRKRFSKGQIFRNVLTATTKAGKSAARMLKRKSIETVEREKLLTDGMVKSRHYSRANLDNNPSWEVEADGAPIAVGKLKHGQASWGVLFSANRGRVSRLKGAFIAKLANGHEGVFMRDTRRATKRVTYIDRRGNRQTKQLPMREVFTSGVSSGLKSPSDREAIMKAANRSFLSVFRRTVKADKGLG